MINAPKFFTYLVKDRKLAMRSAKSYLSNLQWLDSSKLQSLPSNKNLFEVIFDKCNNESNFEKKLNILHEYESELNELIDSCPEDKKRISDTRSALRSFIEYVRLDDNRASVEDVTEKNRKKRSYKSIEKVQIDGMSILRDKFEDDKHFIDFVLSGCYFFSEKDMKEQFNKIADNIAKNVSIPVRKSEKKELFKLGTEHKDGIKRGLTDVIFNDGASGDILVDIDRNGNYSVDQLFIKLTG